MVLGRGSGGLRKEGRSRLGVGGQGKEDMRFGPGYCSILLARDGVGVAAENDTVFGREGDSVEGLGE